MTPIRCGAGVRVIAQNANSLPGAAGSYGVRFCSVKLVQIAATGVRTGLAMTLSKGMRVRYSYICATVVLAQSMSLAMTGLMMAFLRTMMPRLRNRRGFRGRARMLSS